VDQRLEADESGVAFAAEDGTLLAYPVPEGGPVLPQEGPQWPLTRSPDGGYALEQPELGRILYFAPDGAGRLPITAIFDNDGNRIHFCHDSQGILTEIRHSAGHRIEVETTAGLITALTLLGRDETDRTLLVRYGYDRNLRLTEVINSSGQPLRFAYDDRGRIVRWEDRNGRSYEFVYDEFDRCVRGDGAEGHLSYTFEYDRENRTSRATDSLGHTTSYQMNEDFQLVREIGPLGHVLEWEWDRHDRLIARTDALGRTTRYTYDDGGDLLAITRPDRSQTLIEYDGRHRPVTMVQPDGAVWRREYDESGRLAAIIDPLGAVSRYQYGEGGYLRSFTDEEGNRTEVECDALGKPLVITDPLGAKTCYGYDGLGRVATVTDPLGGITRFGWTVEGGHWQRSLPDGSLERRVYDGEGNVREEVDANGGITRTDFGPFDLPVTEIAPDGGRTRYAYDTELRLISVTDPHGLRWSFEYDPAGNLVREKDFDGRELSYRYDAAGQLVARTNGAGEVTTFSWDVLGNVIEKRAGALLSRFEYDAAGRLTRAVNADADLTYTYDALGRVVAETCNGRSVLSEYDRAGRRVRRRTPSGAESAWAYGATGAPVELRTRRGTVGFAYDQAGREIWRGFGRAGLTQTWDANHRLLSQTVAGAPAAPGGVAPILQHRTYLQRADNAVTGVEDLLSGRQEFGLDRVGRVTELRGAAGVEQYSYDRSGNITAAQWRDAGQTPATATVLGAREYSGTLLSRAGSAGYRYDPQGRLVWREQAGSQGAGWSFTWNAEDRLTEVLTPHGQRWRYRYDALGRRVAKQRLAAGTEQVVEETVFVWDAETLAEENRVSGPGAFHTTTWDWEPGELRPVGQTERASTGAGANIDERFYAIVTDLIGAPMELLDDAGQVVWHRRQSLWGVAFGEVPGAPTTPLRFPGQYFDAETGLHYNFHRYYDPQTGRFASADPLGVGGGLNAHAYVPNPLVWSDPLGLMACKGKGKGKNGLDENGLVPDKGGKGATSPEGLHYDTRGTYGGQNNPRGEKSRLDHILLHGDNDNPRFGRVKADHGVWGTQRGNAWDTPKITKTIDQGWAKRNDPGTVVTHQGDRTVYTIPMGKTVGYKGNDPLTSLQLVVEGKNNVITAFPM
jgi:RHS repeat-associated protein